MTGRCEKEETASEKIRTKPNAIITTKKECASYADILRKIISDSGLEKLGLNVTYIRKTMTGDRIELIELKKNLVLSMQYTHTHN